MPEVGYFALITILSLALIMYIADMTSCIVQINKAKGKRYKECREQMTEMLRDKVKNDGIKTLEMLEDRIATSSCGKDIAPYEDVLSPIGYSVCDRCGALVPSDEGLLWIDSFGWEDDNPRDQYMLKALAREKANYTAVCWQCVDELGEGYDE